MAEHRLQREGGRHEEWRRLAHRRRRPHDVTGRIFVDEEIETVRRRIKEASGHSYPFEEIVELHALERR